ncbi:MAG: hypothetical protein HY240_11295 [Actinobacteria bacterium]|nr:hypothetical protein [Actinomycetota bacterium]
MQEPTSDAFDESVVVVREANERGIPLKLIGGQAVRLLCPLFPHRARNDQDMDFASVSSKKRDVMEFLFARGFLGDRKFNLLHGDRQMYFTTADGRTSVDVIMDRLNMCHVLDFKDRIDRLPDTLDVTDLLLTKLQIFELNRKDVHDILHLLSGFPVKDGDEPQTIATGRVGKIVGEDWGWWRTVTMNLEKVTQLADGEHRDLIPQARAFDPAGQALALLEHCRTCPKTMKWKLRAKVGDRVQWYELPEEVGH